MNTRLEQQALDALRSYERLERWRAQTKMDWERAKPQSIAGTWKPTMTEQQQKEHEQYVNINNLPF